MLKCGASWSVQSWKEHVHVELEMKRYRCKIIPGQNRFLWASGISLFKHPYLIPFLPCLKTPRFGGCDTGKSKRRWRPQNANVAAVSPLRLMNVNTGWKEWWNAKPAHFSQGPPWFGRCRWVNGLFLGFRLVKVLKLKWVFWKSNKNHCSCILYHSLQEDSLKADLQPFSGAKTEKPSAEATFPKQCHPSHQWCECEAIRSDRDLAWRWCL